MKILFSAFACNPYKGSEAYCGWSWPLAMCKYHEVYVVTRKENKNDIEIFLYQNNLADIHMLYCDIPNFFNLYYKFGKGYFLYYELWQRSAYKFIKKLHEIEKFDCIHHITLGDFRNVGYMWKINTKFVFGPVGGGQVTPKELKSYIRGHGFEETKRLLINCLVKYNPYFRRALRKTNTIYAANEETQNLILDIVHDKKKCKLLSENGISYEYFQSCDRSKHDSSEVVIMWAGRMIYRKGLKLLLDVLKELHTEIKYKVNLYGSGPEEEKLKFFCKKYKLDNKVIFKGNFTFEAMRREYSKGDIFVFPSIRETTGTVLLEAMSNGMAIIALNQNGAKLLLNDDCGILVSINSKKQVIKELGNALKLLIENEKVRINLGENARHKLKSSYIWENKTKIIANEYVNNGR